MQFSMLFYTIPGFFPVRFKKRVNLNASITFSSGIFTDSLPLFPSMPQQLRTNSLFGLKPDALFHWCAHAAYQYFNIINAFNGICRIKCFIVDANIIYCYIDGNMHTVPGHFNGISSNLQCISFFVLFSIKQLHMNKYAHLKSAF